MAEGNGPHAEDIMEDIHTDETSEARHLLATAYETLPDDSIAVENLLRAVRRRHTRRRRSRVLSVAGGTAVAAGAAAAVFLSVNVAAAPPALAAVTGALSRAEAGSFAMNLTVTAKPALNSPATPLHITGKLDLKRNLGQETISNGWQTLIVGGTAYTKILPSQTKQYDTGGKLWTTTPLWVAEDELPYKSPGGRLAWDFNSNRPFNPQAVLAVLNSDPNALDNEGPVSGPGWTGTKYTFVVSHPKDTGGVVDSISCNMGVDSKGYIRNLTQTTVFATGGNASTSGKQTYTADFTFSDFGTRFSVTPPPANETTTDVGVGALQF
jgi:hypothetical protein